MRGGGPSPARAAADTFGPRSVMAKSVSPMAKSDEKPPSRSVSVRSESRGMMASRSGSSSTYTARPNAMASAGVGLNTAQPVRQTAATATRSRRDMARQR